VVSIRISSAMRCVYPQPTRKSGQFCSAGSVNSKLSHYPQLAAQGALNGDGLERTLGDGHLGAPRFRNLARFSSKTREKRGNNWVSERKSRHLKAVVNR
jgi:hypothetical protein